MLSFNISYYDEIKCLFFADTTERGDRGGERRAQRQGEARVTLRITPLTEFLEWKLESEFSGKAHGLGLLHLHPRPDSGRQVRPKNRDLSQDLKTTNRMWIETSGDDEGSGGRSDACKALLRAQTKRSCARTAVVARCSFTPFASSISAFLLCFSPASCSFLAYSGLLSTSLCA
jgi:hypothetical protein